MQDCLGCLGRRRTAWCRSSSLRRQSRCRAMQLEGRIQSPSLRSRYPSNSAKPASCCQSFFHKRVSTRNSSPRFRQPSDISPLKFWLSGRFKTVNFRSVGFPLALSLPICSQKSCYFLIDYSHSPKITQRLLGAGALGSNGFQIYADARRHTGASPSDRRIVSLPIRHERHVAGSAVRSTTDFSASASAYRCRYLAMFLREDAAEFKDMKSRKV